MVNPPDARDQDVADEASGLLAAEEVPMVKIEQPNKAGSESNESDASTSKKPQATEKQAEPAEFVGLTKEELEKFAKDPFWRRLRLILFALFWIVWFAMLAAVVVIIVVSPKCPPRPARHFWQKPFYRVQLRSFAPSSMSSANSSKIGTVSGFSSKVVDYLQKDLGFDNFLLDGAVKTSPTGCSKSPDSVDADVGNFEEFRALAKLGRKKGFGLMLVLRAGNGDCHLNATESGLRMLNRTVDFWLNAGLSGFLLDIVDLPGGNASAFEFVRAAAAGLREAKAAGKSLALFVDAGDVEYAESLVGEDLADLSVSRGLGVSLAGGRSVVNVASVLKAAAGSSRTLAYQTQSPSQRRSNDSLSAGLLLTLPGVPIVYYGQELSMGHVEGAKPNFGGVSETPMQWSDSDSAGWLPDSGAKLNWCNLNGRRDDIRFHNLVRVTASGQSNFTSLQLITRLVAMVSKTESLQWGNFTLLPNQAFGVYAFVRKAEGFPAVLVIVNVGSARALVQPPADLIGQTVRLSLLHAAAGGGYVEGREYEAEAMLALPNSVLVFTQA